MKKIFGFLSIFIMGFSVQSYAVSDADIDRLTTYAIVLGRAAACGVEVEAESKRVGGWMDRRFSKSDQQVYLPIFFEGARIAALDQSNGTSPESCSDAIKVFNRFTWP
ncbi:hypothetical protein [Alcaligenes sp. YSL9]|uniref:hypothetical protein n=1 Tax=Alcaligenes sp. YSL9 TaxID=2939596 RepID=UPI00266B59CC|nr:hypothetical protein [Alcaligenes sp. YSL9]